MTFLLLLALVVGSPAWGADKLYDEFQAETAMQLHDLREEVERLADAVEILAGRRRWFVSPCGDDAHAGDRRAPFKTAKAALDKVGPGETVIFLDPPIAGCGSERGSRARKR